MKKSLIAMACVLFCGLLSGCGAGSTPGASALQQAPIISGDEYFTAQPQQVTAGGSVTLRWNLPEALDVEIVNVATNLPPQGTYVVTPLQATTYVIRGRSLRDGVSSVVRQVMVDVTPGLIASNIDYFWADNLTISEGGATTLHWRVRQCNYVLLESIGHPEDSYNLGCEGTIEIRPRETSQWILRAFGQQNFPIGVGQVVILVIPQPIPSPVIEGFWSDYLNLDAGSKATLHWNVRDADSVVLSTNPNVPQPLSGSVTVQPLETTTYVLTANSVTGQVVSSTVTITVTSRPPEIRSFAADQPNILPGQTTVLRWDIAYCAKAAIVAESSFPVDCSGSWSVAPTQTTTYNLMASGFNGEMSNQIITVNVIEPQPAAAVTYFYADPMTIDRGQSTILRWKVQNCSKVVIPALSDAALPCEYAVVVQPLSTQYYQLAATNTDGLKQTGATLAVNVRQPPAPLIESFYASPSAIKWKQKTTLYWKVRNAKHVELIGANPSAVGSEGSLTQELTITTTFTLRVTSLTDEKLDVPLTVSVAAPTQDELLAELLKKMQGG